MKCKDCHYMRTDFELILTKKSVASFFGPTGYACNRYPMNIVRHKEEPCCGEFQPKPKERILKNEISKNTDN